MTTTSTSATRADRDRSAADPDGKAAPPTEAQAKPAKGVEEPAPVAAAAAGTEDLPRPIGRYMLLRLLARGGMGEVYLASTTGLEGAERPVVLKVIRREHASDPSFLARFLDEARVQAQLQHSGVAQVLDATTDDKTGEPYVVVEHVEGRSLGDVRARAIQLGLRIGWAEAASIAALVAEALAHVHERKDAAGRALAIVHRDLSPQNVMLGYGGDIKLIDFGTARGQNRRCHTVAGVVFAKPGYVAPEVANGSTGDARVDLYALGVMLWELCAGRRFLQGEAADHMAAVARNERNPPPIAKMVGASTDLDAIIAKLTAFDANERYLAARTVACDLAKLLASAPALSNGERGIRPRVGQLMQRLFPTEPGRSRREFAKLVGLARAQQGMPSIKATPAEAKQNDDGRHLLPGTRYELRREIGRGASSTVYEAHHVDLGRRAAIKVLTAEASRSADFSDRFRREARALSRLSHPGLVGLYDFGVSADGRLYCVMELLVGESIDAYLAREKKMPWREALLIGAQALEALSVAHAAGVIHRDIKPANMFLTDDGKVKLIDFGLARGPEEAAGAGPEGVGSKAADPTSMTIFGTPEYMAPEQAASGKVDARADIYALGCVLYEMVTGRLPFAHESAVAVLDAKIKGTPERPCERVPSLKLPEAVDELIMRALARHPSVRFPNCDEMSAAIDVAVAAPDRRRLRGRLIGLSAFAASMAFATVLLTGTAARQLGDKVPWLFPDAASQAAQVEAAAQAAPTGDVGETAQGNVPTGLLAAGAQDEAANDLDEAVDLAANEEPEVEDFQDQAEDAEPAHEGRIAARTAEKASADDGRSNRKRSKASKASAKSDSSPNQSSASKRDAPAKVAASEKSAKTEPSTKSAGSEGASRDKREATAPAPPNGEVASAPPASPVAPKAAGTLDPGAPREPMLEPLPAPAEAPVAAAEAPSASAPAEAAETRPSEDASEAAAEPPAVVPPPAAQPRKDEQVATPEKRAQPKDQAKPAKKKSDERSRHRRKRKAKMAKVTK